MPRNDARGCYAAAREISEIIKPVTNPTHNVSANSPERECAQGKISPCEEACEDAEEGGQTSGRLLKGTAIKYAEGKTL